MFGVMPAIYGSAGPSFPTAGLAGHYDASLIGGVNFPGASGSGNPIDTWIDQSGNSNDFGQAVVGQRPIWISGAQNGLGAVKFDRSLSQFLERAAFISGASAGEMFLVMKVTDAAAVISGWERFGSDSLEDLDTWDISDRVFCGFGSTTRKEVANAPNPIVRTWHLDEIHSRTGNYEYLQNNVSRFSTAASTAGWTGSNFNLAKSITLYQGGEWGELLIYDAEKSAQERTDIQSYLNTKWALGF